MLELVNTRLIPVSPERAFAALSNLNELVRWWGPNGFTSTSQNFDFRPGGRWDMVLHGPDGANYPNIYLFNEIDAPKRAVIEHPSDVHWFELTVTFDVVPGGTLVTWRQRFNDKKHFDEIKDFVASANDEVLARLAAVVAR